MAKQNLSPNQQAYREEVKKLKRRIRDIGKRGYRVNDKNIPDSIPKRVTAKMIEKLKGLRKNIYEFATYYDPIKEEVIKGVERVKQEKQIAARKGWERRRENEAKERQENDFRNFREDNYSMPNEDETIINIIEGIIQSWHPDPRWSSELNSLKEEDVDILKNVWNNAINTYGGHGVARNLKNNEQYALQLINEIMYESGDKYHTTGQRGIQAKITQFAALINGRPLTVEESIDITTLSEAFNEAE